MSTARRTIQVLAALLPLGVAGMSAALAATPGKPAAGVSNPASPGVAARLQAIRAAVSHVATDQTGLEPGDPNIERVWLWGNGGWRNGGWRNGGWRNGGWGNGGWRNWHNGWGNGGWPNFWRNW